MKRKTGIFDNKNWLKQKYCTEKIPYHKIAKECNVCSDVIKRKLIEFNIEIKNNKKKVINIHKKQKIRCEMHNWEN